MIATSTEYLSAEAQTEKEPSTAKPTELRGRVAEQQSKAFIAAKAEQLRELSISFIANDSFDGEGLTQSSTKRLPLLTESNEALVAEVEQGTAELAEASTTGLPAHLARMCETPLLTAEQEQELFRRMNLMKYQAAKYQGKLKRITKATPSHLHEMEERIRRADNLRNYIIKANTRLVMSIARRFADNKNRFDDLLSQGVESLMHAVQKFDYSRGYRFSTYATCAVRRDLYRMVMGTKKDGQRFATGTAEYLDAFSEVDESTPEPVAEVRWNKLTTALTEMLGQLDDRERYIVSHRFGLDESGSKSSYSSLGKNLGISKERVRQLANRALDKLREWAPDHRLETLLS